jgi:hypothetical protein
MSLLSDFIEETVSFAVDQEAEICTNEWLRDISQYKTP